MSADATQHERGSVDEWYPHYVDADDVEFDYAFARCRCGWKSEALGHPASTDYHGDLHLEYGRTVDCGVIDHVIIFKDGSEAVI